MLAAGNHWHDHPSHSPTGAFATSRSSEAQLTPRCHHSQWNHGLVLWTESGIIPLCSMLAILRRLPP